MAYENFKTVTWADLTPITSTRLQQMTINIQQVREANDDKPKGIQRIANVSSNVQITAANALIAHEVIALKNSGGTDNRVNLEAGRFYKISLVFPGIAPSGPGGEDSSYYLALKAGTFGAANTTLASYRLSSGPLLFTSVASAAANKDNTDINQYGRFGAGTYTFVLGGNGATNQSLFFDVIKIAGPSGSNNITGYEVTASETTMQIVFEDAGGTI